MPPVSLATLRKGARGVVVDVRDDAQSLGDEAQSTVSRRLLELGFVPGEPVEVVQEIRAVPMPLEMGRMLWIWNAAVEATRLGARMAVVCDIGDADIKTRMTQRGYRFGSGVRRSWFAPGVGSKDGSMLWTVGSPIAPSIVRSATLALSCGQRSDALNGTSITRCGVRTTSIESATRTLRNGRAWLSILRVV